MDARKRESSPIGTAEMYGLATESVVPTGLEILESCYYPQQWNYWAISESSPLGLRNVSKTQTFIGH